MCLNKHMYFPMKRRCMSDNGYTCRLGVQVRNIGVHKSRHSSIFNHARYGYALCVSLHKILARKYACDY